jgi:hypothetical protein
VRFRRNGVTMLMRGPANVKEVAWPSVSGRYRHSMRINRRVGRPTSALPMVVGRRLVAGSLAERASDSVRLLLAGTRIKITSLGRFTVRTVRQITTISLILLSAPR